MRSHFASDAVASTRPGPHFIASHALGKIFASLFLIFWASAAEAQNNRHVTSSGSGTKDGSDWSNACDGFTGACNPASLVRGAVYFVADGDYTGDRPLNFSRAAVGGLRISIKKAVSADHGSSTGWTDTMGNGEAIFDKITFGSAYWTWDGQVGSGTTGFGFKIKPQTCSGSANIRGIDTGSGNAGIHLLHTEIAHCGEDMLRDGTVFSGRGNCSPAGSCGLLTDGIYSNNAARRTTDLQVRYVYIHDLTRNGMTIVGVDNVLIEHVTIARIRGVDELHHHQAIAFTQPPMDNVTIRYSTFVDVVGSAAISWMGSNGATYTNQYVYGNLFYTTSDTDRYWYSPGAIWGRQQNNQSGFRVYNNTFYNVVKPEPRFDGTTVVNVEVRNNLYVNSEFSANPPRFGVTTSHNYYYNNTGSFVPSGEVGQQNGSDDPFVNAAQFDFRLRTHTRPGQRLSSPYAWDSRGIMRGSDGVWDRGAFEFLVGAPNRPANLRLWP